MLLLLPPIVFGADMLTPAYYDGGAMSREADAFLAACQEVQMQHPLENSEGLVAAYDGVVATFRDAPKYRHYISITKIITDKDGKELGKLVTLYAHVELDLDEADGLVMDGTEEFYGMRESLWDPDTGYGFGHPESHGLQF